MFNSNNYTFIDIGLKLLFLEFIFDLPEILFLDDNRINNNFIKKTDYIHPYDINNDKFVSINIMYNLFDVFDKVKNMIIQIGKDLYNINPSLYSYINTNAKLYAIIEYIYIKSNKGYKFVIQSYLHPHYNNKFTLNIKFDYYSLHSINNLPTNKEYYNNGQIKKESWYKENKLHRVDKDNYGLTLPTEIYYHVNGQIKIKLWYENDKLYRNDKDENGLTLPAEKHYYKNGKIILDYWYKDGKSHRDDNGKIKEKFLYKEVTYT
jgi:antitoxin component YwqK of YwqJK toxin-antitoxin module